MRNWRLTIEQVEAGVAAYQWKRTHRHTREVWCSEREFSSALAAAADAEAAKTPVELYAAVYLLPGGIEIKVHVGQRALALPQDPEASFDVVVGWLSAEFPRDEQGRYIVGCSRDVLFACSRDNGDLWHVGAGELLADLQNTRVCRTALIES